MRRWFLVVLMVASVVALAVAGTASFPWQIPLP